MSRIVRNTFALTLAHVVTKGFAFVMAVAWARYLGADGLGRLAVILSIASIFGVASDIGLNLLTVREVSRIPSMALAWLGRALSIKLLLGLLLLPVAIVAGWFISGLSPILPLFIACVAVYVEAPMHLVNGIFRAIQRMELEAMVVSTWRFGVAAFTIAALAIGGGVTGVTVGLVAGAAAGVALAFRLLASRRGELAGQADPPPLARMLRLGLPYGLQAVLATIYFRIDIVMLSRIRGDHETGLYQAAYHLVEGLLFVPYALTSALLPVLSSDFSSGRVDAVNRDLNAGIRSVLLLGLPAAVGLLLTSRGLAPLIFGTEFAQSSSLIAWLSPAIPLMFLSLTLGTAAGAVDRQDQSALATGLCVIINIALNLALIPRFGGRGAAVATLVSEVVLLGSLTMVLLRSGVWRPHVPALPAICVATIFMGSSVALIRGLGAIPAVVCGVLVYGVTVLALRVVTTSDIRRMVGALR